MTCRTVISRGLIAGLSYSEMWHMEPGFVIDMFTGRMKYDDQQHGIKRVKEPQCIKLG